MQFYHTLLVLSKFFFGSMHKYKLVFLGKAPKKMVLRFLKGKWVDILE